MNCPDPLLLQCDFESGKGFFNFGMVELGLGDKLLKLAASAGTLQQHKSERQLGEDAAAPAQPDQVDKLVDGFLRGIAAQVDDDAAATLQFPQLSGA